MLAGIFMAPVLTVISDFIGILGGWVIARYQLQVNSGLYWSSITKGLYMQDVWMGLSKPFVFRFLIVTIACHVGLRTTGGTAGNYVLAPTGNTACDAASKGRRQQVVYEADYVFYGA